MGLSFDFRQHILKNGVVMFYTVVKVNGDHLVGEVVDLFLVGVQLGGLILAACQLLVQPGAFHRGSGGKAVCQVLDGGAVAALQFMYIVGADAGDGVRAVAVQVDQALEAVFLAGIEQPVNRALLVDFAVVGVEIV